MLAPPLSILPSFSSTTLWRARVEGERTREVVGDQGGNAERRRAG